MTQFICFGSGSSGNCYYLCHDGHGLVIDLGIGIRHFKKHFSDYGLSLAKIDAILVTHDHTDHVKAVGVLSNEFHLPVYASEAVHNGMQRNHFMSKKVKTEDKRFTEADKSFEIGPFHIVPFDVPHDSSANSGYFITVGDLKFCLITDAGHVTENMKKHLREATHIVLEANYDEAMLATGPYPAYLKKRIMSERGHLSNIECAETLATCLHPEIRQIWLCHLSEENNHPELARKTISAAVEKAGIDWEKTQLNVLRRTVPSALHEL